VLPTTRMGGASGAVPGATGRGGTPSGAERLVGVDGALSETRRVDVGELRVAGDGDRREALGVVEAVDRREDLVFVDVVASFGVASDRGVGETKELAAVAAGEGVGDCLLERPVLVGRGHCSDERTIQPPRGQPAAGRILGGGKRTGADAREQAIES
jgi:hypothetical protein